MQLSLDKKIKRYHYSRAHAVPDAWPLTVCRALPPARAPPAAAAPPRAAARRPSRRPSPAKQAIEPQGQAIEVSMGGTEEASHPCSQKPAMRRERAVATRLERGWLCTLAPRTSCKRRRIWLSMNLPSTAKTHAGTLTDVTDQPPARRERGEKRRRAAPGRTVGGARARSRSRRGAAGTDGRGPARRGYPRAAACPLARSLGTRGGAAAQRGEARAQGQRGAMCRGHGHGSHYDSEVRLALYLEPCYDVRLLMSLAIK